MTAPLATLNLWNIQIPVPAALALVLSAVIHLLWIAFFAQFALPVRNFGQRILAFNYLFRYSLDQHGPAIKIDNGKIPDRYPREVPHQQGVIVLDTASAALLRTRGNKKAAADLLGLQRTTLVEKLRRRSRESAAVAP